MAIWRVSSVNALQQAVAGASSGDTIKIQAGTYHVTSSAGINVNKSLTFEGEGGRADFHADVGVSKGIFTIQNYVSSTTFDRIGFFDAANGDKNGAGIRQQGGDLTVKNSYFGNNQDGILGNANAGFEGTVHISNSQFIGNGYQNGLAHGIYIRADTLIVENSTFRDTDSGHHIKSISAHTIIRDNVLDDGTGDASHAIDVTAGGSLMVEDNRIVKGVAAENDTAIFYDDSRGAAVGDVVIQNNTMINHHPGGEFFVNGTPTTATVSGNAITGMLAGDVLGGKVLQIANILNGQAIPSNVPGVPGNAAPDAAAATASGSEDVVLHGRLAATDANGDQLTFSLNANGGPTHGNVAIASDGSYAYTPDAGFSGADAFTYRVADGKGGLDTAVVNLTVAAVADVPVLTVGNSHLGGGRAGLTQTGGKAADVLMGSAGNDTLIGNAGKDVLHGDSGAVASGRVAALAIAVASGDPDGSESLRIVIEGLPAGAVLSAGAALGNGAWSLGPANLAGLTLTLPNDLAQPLDLTVTATATDGGVTSAPVSANLTVSPGAAGTGDDVLIGGTGNDVMFGGNGNDTFKVTGSGDGFDLFHGGDGVDTILGSSGNDAIGFDKLFGPANSVEAIDGGAGFDVLRGSDAADKLDFSATALTSVERIDGGAGKDSIVGSAGNDVIVGGTGNDILSGGGGDDTFLIAGAGQGADTFDGGAGHDAIFGAIGDDVIGLLGAFGPDNSVEAIVGGGGFDVIVGTDGAENYDFSATTLTGIAQIQGGRGNDVIIGSAGDDVIVGGRGNDRLTGGDGADTFVFDAANGQNTVTDFGIGDSLSFEGFSQTDLVVQQVGADTHISVLGDGLKVTLSQTNAADLGYSTSSGAEPGVVIRLDETPTS